MPRILLIDHDPLSRNTLKDALSGEHTVAEASDAAEAIASCQAQRPDLILLDMEMPDQQGASVCLRLKEVKETKYIPLVLLSQHSQKQGIIDGLHAGADDYVMKPIVASEILARIDAHLRTHNYYTDLDNNDLRLLLELTEIISVTRNPKKILNIIVETMAKAIDVSRCSIICMTDEGDLIVKASSDLPEHQEILLDLEKYPEIERAMTTQRPVVLQDIGSNPLMEPVRERIKGLSDNSIFVAPIIKKQHVIGSFFLRTSSPLKGGITERIFKLCQVVANISGNALENAVLFEAIHSSKRLLEDLVIRDSLTGLFNHQYCHTRMEEEFSRAHRYNTALSCVFVDIDDFKNINDGYGHITGDVVIKKIANLIQQTLRKSDTAFRYGGEEFAILLPNTDSNGANIFAHRVGKLIRDLSVEKLRGTHITASIGVATFCDRNLPCYEDLLHLADSAMYEAKSSGKDRIHLAEPSPEFRNWQSFGETAQGAPPPFPHGPRFDGPPLPTALAV
ncbi:MAG: diguanylate cyclase [Deferrisomatales bacterium]|nr:diguanylate cyclase [Deferrisomatales bacterium]